MRRRSIQGYLDMGPIRIPPLPQGMVLTDRDDGTLWLLSYTLTPPAADGLGYFTINDSIPANMETVTYEAYGEPTFDGDLRLIVRGGYLGYEQVTWDVGNSQRVMARIGNSRVFREVYIPSSWQKDGDMIAWKDVEI